ncbi:MAG: PH domain-containing protein [Prevotellaceae bacterium]|jgi:uncharacterized membrane protein YdbT with pleckstrin-like domain|nr:PH domain-containing protein [Prevotellaceae bacterium]
MNPYIQNRGQQSAGQTQNPEETRWSGRSSQWANFKDYLFSALMLLAVFIAVLMVEKYKGWLMLCALYPLGRAFYAWLEVRSTEYRLTNQRLIFKYGIFNRTTSEIELYRVKDVLLTEPWYKRIVGLGDVKLQSSQRSIPDFRIVAIKHAGELREIIRESVEQRRSEKGVSELDTN